MKLLVLPGDGIGPEITSATLAVLDKAKSLFKLDLSVEERDIGLKSLKAKGTTLPEDVMTAIRQADGVVLGPLATYDYPAKDKGGLNPSAELRIGLDLYANVRPAKSRLGVGLTGKPVDLVIYRENTEGFYADRNMHQGIGEFMPTEDMALSIRKVTAHACERIARRAFEAALRPSTLICASVRLSFTDMCGNSSKFWNTMPIRERSLGRSVFGSPTETPSTVIVPFWNGSRAFTHLISVDLPLPEGPQTTTTSPFATSVEQSVSTWKLPYHLLTFLMEIIG